MSQIASLFARLGFDVDSKGLKEFESKLNQATNKTKAHGKAATETGAAVDKATNNNRKSQNKLAREIRANYAKVRTDRMRALADIKRINDELSGGKLKDNQKRDLMEARGRTQQRLDDLVKQEKAAKERLQRQAEVSRRQAERKADSEREKRRKAMERRDEQAHRVRTERAKDAQRKAARQAAEQDRNSRQADRERMRRQSIQERRDYESWRQRGERARQEREQERRHHQQRMREANQYGRARNGRGMSYRGVREQGRAWIPGIGGAYAAIQSTRSYQGYVGTQAGLTAATGSQEQAGREFEFLEQLSRKLGVFIGDMAQSFTSLSANTRNTSLEGQGTRDIFEAVTSYSRVLNLSAADQDGVFRALTQMVGKGQVYAEELRQQMGERLPGSFQAMARASGYGSDEAGITAFYKAVEAGEIKATEVFPQFAEELMKMANEGGALEKAMNNTAAAIGRFRTNVYLANKTLNESGYDKAVRDLMNRSSESIERSTPFWELLGKAMVQVGKAVEVPIELFGAINQKLPLMTEFVKENEAAFKLLGGTLIMAFKPLRSIFLLVYGLASISDILLDPDRDRSWAEWVVQLGLAAGALATILGTMRSIVRVGRGVTGIFRNGVGAAGGAAALGSGGLGTMTLATALSRVALRVTVIGFGASALAEWTRAAFGDPDKSYSENLRNWGDHSMERNNEWRNDPEATSKLGDWWRGLQQADQERRGNFGVINDSNIEAYLAHQQSQAQQGPTSQFGDIHIKVESPDPETAGFDVRVAFQNMLTENLRTASSSQQTTEK